MVILKHYKSCGIWLVGPEENLDEIMSSIGGAFTVYKDVTEEDIRVLKKFGILEREID